MMRPTAIAVAIAVLVARPDGVLAQYRPDASCSIDPYHGCAGGVTEHSSADRLQVLGVNMAIGAVTAAILAKVNGHSVSRAALLGALGSAVTYSGKDLATQRFDGAGLLGRQVGAVGASILRDAVEGTPAFRRVVLPLGFVRLHVDADAPSPVRVRADLAAIVAGGIAVGDGARLDVGTSLSMGTPVFRSHAVWQNWRGAHIGGVVRLTNHHGGELGARIRAHEMIHVIQHDADFIVFAEPVEQSFAGHLPAGRWLHEWADFGVQVPVRLTANWLLPYDSRPWEREAAILSGVH